MSVHPIKKALDSAELVDGADKSEPWPEPLPLPSGLPEVPALNPALIPSELRAWTVDIADRMQCPIDFAAIPAMVALGSIVGRRLGIRPEANTPWTETANLWGCIVGEPGVLKSPAILEVLAPIRKFEANAIIANEEAQANYRKAEALYKLQLETARALAKKQVQKQDVSIAEMTLEEVDEPQPPIEKRYLVTDATVEKLGVICRDNPMGILVHRDELLTMLLVLDRPDKSADRGFFLSGWNGKEGYIFDRIMRGTVAVPSVNLSLIGTAQPNRLGDYLRDSLRKQDDGMVQRIQLLTFPDLPQEWRSNDRSPDEDARSRAFGCFEWLTRLDPSEIGAKRDPFDDGTGIPFLRFEPEGIDLFLEWRYSLEERLRSDTLPSYFVAHLSKYRGLIPRLALIIHLAGGGIGPVSRDACLDAIGWAEYLEGHAKRAYALMSQARTGTAELILQKIAYGDLKNGFTERDVYRPQWSGLTDREAISSALRLLAEHDWIRPKKQATAGRPVIMWTINPAAVLSP